MRAELALYKALRLCDRFRSSWNMREKRCVRLREGSVRRRRETPRRRRYRLAVRKALRRIRKTEMTKTATKVSALKAQIEALKTQRDELTASRERAAAKSNSPGYAVSTIAKRAFDQRSAGMISELMYGEVMKGLAASMFPVEPNEGMQMARFLETLVGESMLRPRPHYPPG